jgi:O-glycosyl hydrolase
MKYVVDIYNDSAMLADLDIWCHHDYGIDDVRYYNDKVWSGNTSDPVFTGYSASGKPVWMTEGEAGNNDWNGAMYLADKIQGSVNAGHVSGYIPWALGDTSTGSVYAVTVFSGGISTYYRIPTYAFKHFSRYIRPGAVRLACTGDNPAAISVSAYRHTGNNTQTIVMVNKGGADTANITIPASPAITSFTVFKSTNGSYWQQSSASVSNNVVSVSVPASSIVTLYGVGREPCTLASICPFFSLISSTCPLRA